MAVSDRIGGDPAGIIAPPAARVAVVGAFDFLSTFDTARPRVAIHATGCIASQTTVIAGEPLRRH